MPIKACGEITYPFLNFNGDYISMLGLKFNPCYKKWATEVIFWRVISITVLQIHHILDKKEMN